MPKHDRVMVAATFIKYRAQPWQIRLGILAGPRALEPPLLESLCSLRALESSLLQSLTCFAFAMGVSGFAQQQAFFIFAGSSCLPRSSRSVPHVTQANFSVAFSMFSAIPLHFEVHVPRPLSTGTEPLQNRPCSF